MTKLLLAGVVAAASAVPVIELDMAGVTVYRHSEWNHESTDPNDVTMSNKKIVNAAPKIFAREKDSTVVTDHTKAFDDRYKHTDADGTSKAGTKQVIYREHDLGYENAKTTLVANGDPNAPSLVVSREKVKSRQDYSERCDAGPDTTTKTCPFPVAKAFDHATRSQVEVTTRVFRVDVNGLTCTSDVAACDCVKHVAGGGSASCMVNKVDFTKRSTYLFKYDATDAAGNHAEQVVFALILDDVHKPQITLCKSEHSTCLATTSDGCTVEAVEGAADWKLCPGTVARDNIDGLISDKVVYDIQQVGGKSDYMAKNKPYDEVKDMLSPDTVGKYLVTAKVCDTAGVYGQNSMDNCVEASKDIIIKDNAKPWIILSGEPEHTQECNVKYIDQGATAKDALDTEANGLNLDVKVSGWGSDATIAPTALKWQHGTHLTVDAPKVREEPYVIKYDAKDTAGNDADTVERKVTVRDTKKPKIALKGEALEVHYQGQDFVDTGITCEDSCDGTITEFDAKWIQCPNEHGVTHLTTPLVLGSDDTPYSNPNIKECTFNDQSLGDYVRLYRCKDKSGNANWVTRKYVVQDNTKPVITVEGCPASGECKETYDASLTVEYTDKGAVCADTQRHSGTLSRAVEVSGQVVNMKKPGTYTIRYDCQDDSGNQAVPKTRTIVVADHSCPEIKMLGDQINYVEAGFPYVDAAATATDDLDGDITSAIESDGDTVNVAGAFSTLESCSEIKASFCHIKKLVDENGLPSDECKGSKGPNTGNYFITTKVTGGAFTRQNVWCDFTSDSKLAYTYYPCSGCAQAKRDGSEQGDCASIGLEMASVHTTGAKRKFDKKFWEDDNSSSEYLCSTNDQANVITDERLEHITALNPNLAHAEAGTFVIDYYVEDSSKNAQCSSPKRTVIVRDTLPPVISLHLDDKLIHVSDATKLGLGNGADKNAKAVNRAGDPKYNAALKDNVKDMLMSEQGSTTNNVWLLAAAASAVTGLALLSSTSKRVPVSVPV